MPMDNTNQLQGLPSSLTEAMSPLHRIERYQDRLLQDKRILTNRMEQVLKEAKDQGERLIRSPLDASIRVGLLRVAIPWSNKTISPRFGCESKRRRPAVPHHERWPVRSRGKTCRKKRNLKKI